MSQPYCPNLLSKASFFLNVFPPFLIGIKTCYEGGDQSFTNQHHLYSSLGGAVGSFIAAKGIVLEKLPQTEHFFVEIQSNQVYKWAKEKLESDEAKSYLDDKFSLA